MLATGSGRRRRGVVLRRRGDGGAVAVEAALITPLIMLLLFGIIEFGFVFKNHLAVSSSTRAGARIASAMPRADDFAIRAAESVVREGAALERQNIVKVWVYRANASTGLPDSGNFSSCTACVRFAVDPSTGTPTATYDGWQAASQNACVNDPAHDYVGVYVEYSNPGVTGLIFNSLTLSDRSVMSLEPLSNTVACKP